MVRSRVAATLFAPALAVGLAAALSGCTIGAAGVNGSSASTTAPFVAPFSAPTFDPSSSTSASASSSGPVVPSALLASDFAKLLGQTNATVGLAFAPVGGRGPVEAFGAVGDVAWSTSKVPLAIAAGALGPAHDADIANAIIESDNAAAQRLWDALGGGAVAAGAVQKVIAEAGDTTTRVQPTVTRPGFTAFGQTEWTYRNEAVFVAHLPCMQPAHKVLTLMQNVAADQHWGVQTMDGSAVKGGWGPTTDGQYYVRQMAVISTGSGQVGVAMGTVAPTFAAGQQVLDEVGLWVREHGAELPGGKC